MWSEFDFYSMFPVMLIVIIVGFILVVICVGFKQYVLDRISRKKARRREKLEKKRKRKRTRIDKT